ncbi:MAG: GUN4 domain-containing protein [Xenococcaceae cyanobacterium]
MKPSESYLLMLFAGLQQAGLPLRIEDYHLLLKAWKQGFHCSTYRELQQLCCRLWAKSPEEQKRIEDYFERYLAQFESPAESTKPVLPDFSKSTPKTRPLPQQTPPGSKVRQPVVTNRPRGGSSEDLQVAQAVPRRLPEQRQIPPGSFVLPGKSYPVTRRQMQYGWRSLYQPTREGEPTELDMVATVEQIAKQGILLEPVLLPSLINRTELLLLVDGSNSMVPFHPLPEQLVETTQQQGHFSRCQVRYFRNVPKDLLYTDSELLNTETIADLQLQLHPARTVVLIFSDAGAARGGFNPARGVLTDIFLARLGPRVRHVAWLNPLPADRWSGTTASNIAARVPMFALDESGWRELLRELRGQPSGRLTAPSTVPERPERRDFARQVRESLNRLLEDEGLRLRDGDDFRYEVATRRLEAFAERGRAYFNFACHAAFPLALTPHWLYYLRENFREDFREYFRSGFQPELPWLAVPDLLLSSLCHPAGYQLYEMDAAVRHLLLLLLKERFGPERLERLSNCLLFYVQQGLGGSYRQAEDFGERPEWIALAYTQPTELARQLAERLQQLYPSDQAEWVRLASFSATFVEPLGPEFQPLLTYARGMGRLARDDREGAEELFEQIPTPELTIAGVTLKVPGEFKLLSEKGVDYTKLHDLLADFKWKEADQETSDRMLQAMSKKNWWDVEKKDILNFPCLDLRTINSLWLKFSNGKFGFSVQKDIWTDCGGKPGEYNWDIYQKFCDLNGWRKGGGWLNYDELTFNTKAPRGHLPTFSGGHLPFLGGAPPDFL